MAGSPHRAECSWGACRGWHYTPRVTTDPGPTQHEAARLAALRTLAVLDTEAEPQLDNLTQLAADLLGLPIALVSLVDADRQWFKSRVGLGATQTPREHAFCAHAIHGTDVFVVNDATEDPRFADNPLVTGDPNIRFYAGAPLVTREGHALGTLCVIGDAPRDCSGKEARILEALARQVMTLLEYRKVSSDLAAAVSKVAVLSGLVPVCAWCKQVRDDDGFWHDVDRYIATQTEAEVTHSICPKCADR